MEVQLPTLEPDGLLERRYLAVVGLSRTLADATDWGPLAEGIGMGLEEALIGDVPGAVGVRLWARTSGGHEELARHPIDRDFERLHPHELQRAAESSEPISAPDGDWLVGLHSGGVTLGVLGVDGSVDSELIGHVAPLVASRVALLAGQGVGDVLVAPASIGASQDAAELMSSFASEAKRLLDHDRLSAYLLTCDGRAFERFAVATSPIIPGEGVVIPFEDVGLRHVVITNKALVSRDLATDPRIVGREDRVIARAGFHGLLSVPLRPYGRPIGVLNFVSRQPGFYGDAEVPIAQQIGDQIAAFLGNLQTQDRMRTLISHEAAERERVRVARELYHAVAQTVPAIERLTAEISGGPEPGAKGEGRSGADVGELAEHVRRLARKELTEVRRAVADLVPQGLESHSLEEAIRAALSALGQRDPEARLSVVGDTASLAGAVRRGAFRLFQEALTNVRHHARAKRVEVTLRSERDLVLSIADDGVGFDPADIDDGDGLGIRFMHERARALGGLLEIESAPGAGTVVKFELAGARDVSEGRAGTGDGAYPPVEGPSTGTLRVFVAERHHLTRAGLVSVVDSEPDLRVVGEARTAEEARGQLARLRPDVVLIDAQLADGDLQALIRETSGLLPGAAILVLSSFRTWREAEFLDAGARGVVDKLADGPGLIESVRAVAAGATVGLGAGAASENGSRLTARERSILSLVASGSTNEEIGKTLFLATKTVERHVAGVVRKLGARNRVHAAAIAVSRQIIDLPER